MTKQKESISPCELWARLGLKRTRDMCNAVGTSYEYWRHITHKRRRMSLDMARNIIAWLETNEPRLSKLVTIDSLIPPMSEIDY